MRRATNAVTPARRVAWGVALTAAAVLLPSAGYAAWHLYRPAQMAKASTPFESAGAQGGLRVLVIGDSTAEGTGASRPEASLAGLIAAQDPTIALTNRGRDGARFADFAAQIPPAQHFDAIVVVGGGNDVFRFTAEGTLRTAAEAVAHAAMAQAPLVVFVPPGNVGNAPFFLPPWRALMAHRAAMLQRIVGETARARGALHVSLFKERADDPFAQQPERMNAPDGLHPSDEGYDLWFAELERQARFLQRLRAVRSAADGRGPAD